MISANKGEWSESYAFIKLLSTGKLYSADEKLNKNNNMYFPIDSIMREEVKGKNITYKTLEGKVIVDSDGGETSYNSSQFADEANYLFKEINDASNKGSFAIDKTEKFLNSILCYKASAPSTNKSDITMKIVDINTGYNSTVGFSIKSELGASPTLLNAGKTTNFVFEVADYPFDPISINNIQKHRNGKYKADIKGRVAEVYKYGQLDYKHPCNATFRDNLELIDSKMDEIIAVSLLYYYRYGISSSRDILDKLIEENPLNYNNLNAYRYKLCKFLTAIALGMMPSKEWDGIDEASGGYIIVTKQGDVLAYHLHNRNCFENYLLEHTKFETASSSRHNFGNVYIENGRPYLNLNLQIRFK